MGKKRTRREFLRRATLAASGAIGFPAIVPASALGADGHTAPSERILVGCIGVGPQGNGVMGNFLRHSECRVVAVCDVNGQRTASTKARVDGHYKATDCATYGDFRELVARDDIDVCLIGSTDHWHVLHALAAARAGKDMYVEKPLGLSLADEIALRETIQTYGRRFQFGTQQRSSREFRFACELVQNGRIGRLHTIRVGVPASIEQPAESPVPVPDWLDYELWQGPAPRAPYTEHRIVNGWWWHNSNYALGFVAGWGIHHVDIAQWGNASDDTGPVEIEGTGVFPKQGMCDCATSWNVECTYANGVKMIFSDNQQNPQGAVFEGDEGQVYVRRGHLETKPESLARSVIGPNEIHLYESNDHVGNLLDCVRTRAKTVCPIETAVRSDTICHLADIAMRLERKLEWDPAAERFVDDPEADRMLHRAMRSPWRV